jgi:hypothetical protein
VIRKDRELGVGREGFFFFLRVGRLVLAFLFSLLILLIRAASLTVVTPFLATTQMLAAEFLHFGICEGAKNRPARARVAMCTALNFSCYTA